MVPITSPLTVSAEMVFDEVSLSATYVEPSDLNLINLLRRWSYYVRSYTEAKKCLCCDGLLILGDDMERPTFLLDVEDVDLSKFTDCINRGGLCKPSISAFDICLKTWAIFNVILQEKTLEKYLMTSRKQQKGLIAVVVKLLGDSQFVDLISDSKSVYTCAKGHAILESLKFLVEKFVNCLLKNLVVKLSDAVRDTCEESLRKSKKFQGIY